MSRKKSIFIVAGEASGDQHAAKLIRELKKTQENIEITGLGGQAMAAAGVELLVDLTQYSVTGFWEVLRLYPVFRRVFFRTLKHLTDNPPDLLILVDYPGFNLRLAKRAKRLGIKILYYISPQIWAWKAGRVHTIKKVVDHMAVVFPFEVALYEKHGVPVSFVGHPLVGEVNASRPIAEIKQRLQLADTDKMIALFPGSRLNEVQQLLPVMLAAAERLQQRYHDLKFFIARATTVPQSLIDNFISQSNVNVTVVTDQAHDLIAASDAVITASGTATLEIALLETPMVILYKTAAITYWLAKYLIRIQSIGLCNIISGKAIVPELIQQQANPENIALEVRRIIGDDLYRQRMRKQLSAVRDQLQTEKQKISLAELVNRMLEIEDEEKTISNDSP